MMVDRVSGTGVFTGVIVAGLCVGGIAEAEPVNIGRAGVVTFPGLAGTAGGTGIAAVPGGAGPARASTPSIAAGAANLVQFAVIAAAPVIAYALARRGYFRPGGLGGRSLDRVRGLPAWMWLSAAFTVFVAQLAGTSVAAELFTPGQVPGKIGDLPIRVQALVALGGSAPAIAAGIVLMRVFTSRVGPIGFSAGIRDVPRGAGGLALAYPFISGVSLVAMLALHLVTRATPSPLAHETLVTIMNSRHDPWAWVMAAAVVLGVPVVEEIIYRGFVQSAALSLTGRRWGAIAVTSVTFTGVHVGIMPWYALPAIFALSVSMGVAFERTGRIGVPIAMHIAFNAVNIAMAAGIG